MFIETNKEKLKKIFEGDERMKKTVEDLSVLEFYKTDEEFYESYDHDEFKKTVEEQARQEDMKEAKEEGIKEGITERNIEIAKEMLKDNTNLELISKYTNLSIDEIEKLK